MTAPSPSASRFATHENSAYPQLWRGCVGAWCPSLGPSGSRLHDYSRRNNWGTLTNMDPATDWVVSGGAYALDFDGSNDQVVANLVLSGRSTQITASCWANLSSTSLRGAFMRVGATGSQGSLSDDGFSLGVGDISLDTNGNNIIGEWVGTRWIASGVAYGTGWHHVVLVIDSSGFPIIYRDGVSVYSDTGALMTTIGSRAGGVTLFGGYSSDFPPGYPRYFTGMCDDFRIYDRILSPAEISLLSRRRGIAFTPRTRARGTPEQAAGGATPWLYTRRRSQIIGAGGVH